MLKKLTVSFDIDTELFARMLMHAPSVRFEAYGTDASRDPLALPRQRTPLALPPPSGYKRNRTEGGAAKIILDQLLTSAVPLKPSQLRPAVVDAGYSANTVTTAIYALRTRGLARKLKKGYVATAKATGDHKNGH